MGNFISAYKETEAGAAWREKAQGFNDQRSIAFEKSQIAYQQGDHAMAKHWSTTGKTLGQKMEDANERAAKAIFDSLNKAGAHPPRTYDFHGLHVKECLRKLDELTKYAQRQKWSDMTIIVGRGNHSLHGIAKLPSAVEDFAQEHSDVITCYHLDQPNKGCIFLELSGGRQSMCMIM